MLQKLFGFDPTKHKVKTELMAGLTSFLTMAYILAVNPNIFSALADQGMDTNVHSHSYCQRYRHISDGHLCKDAVRTCPRHGSERIFCIYGLPYDGIHVAICVDSNTLGGYPFHHFEYHKNTVTHCQCHSHPNEGSHLCWHRPIHRIFGVEECKCNRR